MPRRVLFSRRFYPAPGIIGPYPSIADPAPKSLQYAKKPVYREPNMKSSEERPDHKSKEGDEVDWEELRNFVVDQIKRAGRNISRHIAESDKAKIKAYVKTRGGNFESWYDRLEKSGVLESDLQGDGRSANRRPASRVPANRGREQESGPFSVFRRFREKVTRKARSTATALRVHLVVYAGVNLLLLMLWGMTGAGFPWFLIPAAGWGIGMKE